MDHRRRTFCLAVTSREFDSAEVVSVEGVDMLVAYRADPASAAGKGYLASYPLRDWVKGW